MHITIQRDSRIAIQEHDSELRYADPSDPLAIYSIFRAIPEFEDGLTLRQLMKALRPWKHVLGRAAWMDFDAWLEGLDKTHLVNVTDDDEPQLSSIEIYCVLDLWRDDETVYLGSHWDFVGRYSPPIQQDGMTLERVSLTFSDPKTFANLPIKILARPTVHDQAVGGADSCRPILSESLPGVYRHLQLYPTFFETIVLGLLDKISFHGDPEDASNIGEELSSVVANIKMAAENPDEAADGLEGLEILEASDFFIKLGLPDDDGRRDICWQLYHTAKDIRLPNPELAELLDVTDLGLYEIKNGIVAHYSTKRIESMIDIMEGYLGTKPEESAE